MKRTKAKGILGDALAPRPVTERDSRILKEADRITAQQSAVARTNAAIREIRSYVLVSNHPIWKKIENLEADLERVGNPRIKKALERAISELRKGLPL